LTSPHAPTAAAPARWTGRTRGGIVGNSIFLALVRLFGLRPAYALLAFVAAYYVLSAPAARRASADYRRRLGLRGGLWGAYRHFFSFGQILLDRVAIIAGRADAFRIEFDGEAHIRSALQEGKGVVIISAHCGNWEAAGHLLQRLGVPVNVVAYRGEAAHVRRLFDRALRDRRFALIEADGSPDAALAIMAALARGEIVAMHADRTLGDERIAGNPPLAVPFLGAPARFPSGPYAVAALSGSPLVHAFALREGTYRYHFRAYPPEHLRFADRASRGQLLQQWAGRFAERLEAALRQCPYQWGNFYPFWVL